jgi:hypothetical protein
MGRVKILGRFVTGLPPVYFGANTLMLSFVIINPIYMQFAKNLKTTFFVVMLDAHET